ncbi:MAG: hypothetical protein LUG65_02120 [Clostridiales bacterium]|nr:hypothetical protein [Clostridiales bacterium]
MNQEVHQEVKQYADVGDRDSLRYIFVDALDVDPTFAYYEGDYNYCKAKGLLEPHKELTPFTDDQSKWTRDYWAQLKVDLIKNFSEQRMDHMRQVAQVYLADKIKRLEAERAARQEEQARQLEEKKKQLEEENQRIAAKQAAQAKRVAQARQAAAQTQTTQDRKTTSKEADSSKKVIGVVAIAVVVIGIVLFLILGHNPN